MLFKVECPCCHGEGSLLVYDEAHPHDPPVREKCVHCQGSGKVEAEVESED